MIQALRCNAGPTQDSCWNPFGTTYLMMDPQTGMMIGDPNTKFPEPNDPGWTPSPGEEHTQLDAQQYKDMGLAHTAADYSNTEQEHRLAGNVMSYNIQELGMTVVDVVAQNNQLFDLWYNDEPVGFAVGIHWRLETEEYRPHALAQSAIGGNRFALRKSEQTSQAIFAELGLPLLQSETWGEMEAQLALRYTEIEGKGIYGQPGTAKFTTTIPKFAIRYAPVDWLALRGSITQGFVTPGPVRAVRRRRDHHPRLAAGLHLRLPARHPGLHRRRRQPGRSDAQRAGRQCRQPGSGSGDLGSVQRRLFAEVHGRRSRLRRGLHVRGVPRQP